MNEKEKKPESLIGEGESVVIRRDVIVGGEVAFKKGEEVSVEKIDPNPGQPENRYVVKSDRLQKRFQLSDKDISRQSEKTTVGRVASTPGEAMKKVPASKTARWTSRISWKPVVIIALVVVVAAGIGVALWLTLGRESAEHKISRLKRELSAVIGEAGDTTTDLSAEIKKAQEQAPNPEAFKPLGEQIAQKYINRYRQYYKETSDLYNQLSDFKPPEELKEQYTALFKAAGSYRQAMVTYVTGLDQIRKGQITEAVKTLSQVKALIDSGNQSLKGTSGSQNQPGQ